MPSAAYVDAGFTHVALVQVEATRRTSSSAGPNASSCPRCGTSESPVGLSPSPNGSPRLRMGRKQGDTDQYQPDAPGWYPDPWSATGGGERYFDGKRWGTNERPRGSSLHERHHHEAAAGAWRQGVGGPVPHPDHPAPDRRVAVGSVVRQESQRDAVLSRGSIDRSIGVTRPQPGAEEAAHSPRAETGAGQPGPGSTSSNARSRSRSRPRSRSTPAVRSTGSTTRRADRPTARPSCRTASRPSRPPPVCGSSTTGRPPNCPPATAGRTCPTVTTATAGRRCWSRGPTRRRSVISSATSPGQPVPTS